MEKSLCVLLELCLMPFIVHIYLCYTLYKTLVMVHGKTHDHVISLRKILIIQN